MWLNHPKGKSSCILVGKQFLSNRGTYVWLPNRRSTCCACMASTVLSPVAIRACLRRGDGAGGEWWLRLGPESYCPMVRAASCCPSRWPRRKATHLSSALRTAPWGTPCAPPLPAQAPSFLMQRARAPCGRKVPTPAATCSSQLYMRVRPCVTTCDMRHDHVRPWLQGSWTARPWLTWSSPTRRQGGA
jgi:hypothetical protein